MLFKLHCISRKFFKGMLCILGLMHVQSGYGQSSNAILPPPPPNLDQLYHKEYLLYDASTRNSFYPFNQAASIQIISFTPFFTQKRVIENAKSDWIQNNENRVTEYGLSIQNDTLIQNKIAQRIFLNPENKDSLTDILYNTCARWNLSSTTSSGCYYPHNAILFFNNNNKLFDFIEICFDCHKIKCSNSKIEKFDDCDRMYDSLKRFFSKSGLLTSQEEFKSK